MFFLWFGLVWFWFQFRTPLEIQQRIYTTRVRRAYPRPQDLSIGSSYAPRSLEVVRRRARCRRRRLVRSRGSRLAIRGRAMTPPRSSREAGARNRAPPPPEQAAPGASPRAASGGRVLVYRRPSVASARSRSSFSAYFLALLCFPAFSACFSLRSYLSTRELL